MSFLFWYPSDRHQISQCVICSQQDSREIMVSRHKLHRRKKLVSLMGYYLLLWYPRKILNSFEHTTSGVDNIEPYLTLAGGLARLTSYHAESVIPFPSLNKFPGTLCRKDDINLFLMFLLFSAFSCEFLSPICAYKIFQPYVTTAVKS